MTRSLHKLAFAFLLAAAGNPALAMCLGFSPQPGETDPLKATVKWARALSSAVFTGTVTAMDYVPAHDRFAGKGERLVVRMAPDRWWKGDASREVTLLTSEFRTPDGLRSMEAHDYHFELGRMYLVYAHGDGDAMATSICARTKPIDAAAADIDKLDALKDE